VNLRRDERRVGRSPETSVHQKAPPRRRANRTSSPVRGRGSRLGIKGVLRVGGQHSPARLPGTKEARLTDFTFHTLPHTFVAILVAAGCNAREVLEWAGHNSVAFTLTRYGGLFEDDTDAAVDRLDDLLGGNDARP
jgi:integrase